jgi:segregation and condensation protein A
VSLLAEPAAAGGFTVHLINFEGPFDLLLQLIGKHKLDITEVALSRVTDEFIAHLRLLQQHGSTAADLDQTSQFIVVAATLLDLKAARLLPQGEVDDAEDLALLEARDLLFARLLQYRAFKEVAAWLSQVLAAEDRRLPRPGGLEEEFAGLLPEVDLTGMATRLAELAGAAMAPRPEVLVPLTHLHAPRVSVREQAELVLARLRERGTLSFRALTDDAEDRLVVVARFLALLELYREQAVAFEQLTALGELTIRWLGTEVGDIGSEFDEPPQPGEGRDD